MPIGLDALTGLLDRRNFLARMAPLQDKWLSIGFLDLDSLKAVNDRHGHQRGDDALRLFATEVRPGTTGQAT